MSEFKEENIDREENIDTENQAVPNTGEETAGLKKTADSEEIAGPVGRFEEEAQGTDLSHQASGGPEIEPAFTKDFGENRAEEAKKKEKRGGRRLPFWLGILIGAVAMFLVVAIVLAGAAFSLLSGTGESSYAAKTEIIRQYINSYFLWDVSEDELENGIYNGLVSALGDKYAAYYTQEEYEELKESVSGTYAGIGVSVFWNDDSLAEVYKVFSGTPAEEAGIQVGDVLVSVDGASGFESLDDLVSAVKGKEGTTVDLVINRGGESIEVTVERRTIAMETVTYGMLDGNIGYIGISEFDTVTAEQFDAAIDELTEQGMESVILDLRDNPGGDYDTVVAMADRVLPEGVIMTVKDKNGTVKTEMSDAKNCLDLPMAVLINGNSASASEVFVGAIQDYDMATIIGEQSFGKGIVQSIFTLPDGSGLKFTTQEYYTPSGDSIHGVGITPDIVVSLPDDAYDDGVLDYDEDTQLQKAVEVLSE